VQEWHWGRGDRVPRRNLGSGNSLPCSSLFGGGKKRKKGGEVDEPIFYKLNDRRIRKRREEKNFFSLEDKGAISRFGRERLPLEGEEKKKKGLVRRLNFRVAGGRRKVSMTFLHVATRKPTRFCEEKGGKIRSLHRMKKRGEARISRGLRRDPRKRKEGKRSAFVRSIHREQKTSLRKRGERGGPAFPPALIDREMEKNGGRELEGISSTTERERKSDAFPLRKRKKHSGRKTSVAPEGEKGRGEKSAIPLTRGKRRGILLRHRPFLCQTRRGRRGIHPGGRGQAPGHNLFREGNRGGDIIYALLVHGNLKITPEKGGKRWRRVPLREGGEEM